jgi:hypothetical protein
MRFDVMGGPWFGEYVRVFKDEHRNTSTSMQIKRRQQ